MKYFTYIIQSLSSGKLYIGQTKDLSKRLTLHNSNQVLSTKHNGPWKIIYFREFNQRMEAMMLENKLKKWKNRERILSWINKQTEKPVCTS
jgi:putative endonuclease